MSSPAVGYTIEITVVRKVSTYSKLVTFMFTVGIPGEKIAFFAMNSVL